MRSQDGTEEHEVAANTRRKQAAITDEEADRLARAGIELEALFGGPQDIEWAIDRERRLFILQCRPLQVAIKATEPVPEPDGSSIAARRPLRFARHLLPGKCRLLTNKLISRQYLIMPCGGQNRLPHAMPRSWGGSAA